MRKREQGIDLLRGIALYFVISVHFYLYNGFYQEPVEGMTMWGASCFRWLFYCCVPLFLLISGYLKGDKPVSRRYYGSLIRILLSFLLISGISIAFKAGYLGQEKTPVQWIGEVLNFKAANYSWYVEMYIGLFLLVPIWTAGFQSVRTKRGRDIFMLSWIALTFFPSLLCQIPAGNTILNLVPDYWISLWPFAYYMLGCYIRKYRPSPPMWICISLAAAVCIAMGSMTYLSAAGGVFGDGVGGGYSNFFVMVLSVLLFLCFYRISVPNRVWAKVWEWVSRLSFDAYLLSWIWDQIFYEVFITEIEPGSYPVYYGRICMPVFLLSLASAVPVYLLSDALSGRIKGMLFKTKKADLLL